LLFPLANPAAAYRHRSVQLISAFGIGPNVRISHKTVEQCRRDIRAAEVSQWSFALLIAEVAIHQLIVNRETSHPGALARYTQRKRIICFSQPGRTLPRSWRFEMDMTLAQSAVAFAAIVFLFVLVGFVWAAGPLRF